MPDLKEALEILKRDEDWLFKRIKQVETEQNLLPKIQAMLVLLEKIPSQSGGTFADYWHDNGGSAETWEASKGFEAVGIIYALLKSKRDAEWDNKRKASDIDFFDFYENWGKEVFTRIEDVMSGLSTLSGLVATYDKMKKQRLDLEAHGDV